LKILADTSVLVALASGSDDDSKSYEFLGNLIENAGYGVWISAVSIRAIYETVSREQGREKPSANAMALITWRI
jgi:predicted nucleic acid-binding protein